MVRREWWLLAVGAIVAFLAVRSHGQSSIAPPDPALTPGAVVETSAEVICEPGYDKAHRVWRGKYATATKYDIPWAIAKLMEDDDLVEVRCGGNNADSRNHWLQLCDEWRELGDGLRECVKGQAANKDHLEKRWAIRLDRACRVARRTGDYSVAQTIVDGCQAYFMQGKWVEDMPR